MTGTRHARERSGVESRTDGRWAGGADVDRTDAASELIGGDLEGPKRERGFSKDGENIGKGGGSLEEPGEGRAPGWEREELPVGCVAKSGH